MNPLPAESIYPQDVPCRTCGVGNGEDCDLFATRDDIRFRYIPGIYHHARILDARLEQQGGV